MKNRLSLTLYLIVKFLWIIFHSLKGVIRMQIRSILGMLLSSYNVMNLENMERTAN